MSQYTRAYIEGGYYFFTVVTHGRKRFLTEDSCIQRLRESFLYVMNKQPVSVEAVVVLPDHLHCIWKMPENDADFSTRWMFLKKHFSIGINTTRNYRSEKLVWQRRFWEHWIRDERDLQRHMDYIYYNPVKHGYAGRPSDWVYSSFEKAVLKKQYPANWGEEEPRSLKGMELG